MEIQEYISTTYPIPLTLVIGIFALINTSTLDASIKFHESSNHFKTHTAHETYKHALPTGAISPT